MKKILLAAGMIAALSACSTVPETPQQTVFAIKGSYIAGLQTAVAYKKLPECKAGGPSLCSDKAVVEKIIKADDVAAPALDAAEKAVRAIDVTGQSTFDKVISAAQAAVSGFLGVVNSLRVK